jgi:hypothetical protein
VAASSGAPEFNTNFTFDVEPEDVDDPTTALNMLIEVRSRMPISQTDPFTPAPPNDDDENDEQVCLDFSLNMLFSF